MDDVLKRFIGNPAGRADGFTCFRWLFQPLMATVLALQDGRKDARRRRTPYAWAMLTQPGHRWESYREGWDSIGKVLILSLILDFAYQIVELRWFYPGEALAVALVLAILPYMALRGLVNRAFSRKARG
jgi:hypothetical protein